MDMLKKDFFDRKISLAESVLYAANAFDLEILSILNCKNYHNDNTQGRFSHPPTNVTMTLSVTTLVWMLPWAITTVCKF